MASGPGGAPIVTSPDGARIIALRPISIFDRAPPMVIFDVLKLATESAPCGMTSALVSGVMRRVLSGPRRTVPPVMLTLPFLETLVVRSEEHTSELQSLMRISYDVFCLKKKRMNKTNITTNGIETEQL